MAIDKALLEQLKKRGALIYDIKGNVDLDSSMKKLIALRDKKTEPVAPSGLSKVTTVKNLAPTVISKQAIDAGDTIKVLPKQTQQTIPSKNLIAQQTIKKQVDIGAQDEEKLNKTKKIISGLEHALKFVTSGKPLPIYATEQAVKSKTGQKFATDVARAPVRAITSVGLQPAADITSIFTGKKIPPIYTPKTKAEKMLFGDEPIKGVFLRVEQAQSWITNKMVEAGTNPTEAQGRAMILAPFFVAGMTSLDLLPFGGGKNTAKLVAESSKADDIFKLIKPMFKNDADNIVKKYAEELVNIKNPVEVRDFIAKKIASISLLPTEKGIGISKGIQEEQKIGANTFINKLAKDNPAFAQNPVMTVEGDRLVFRSGKDVTKVNPKILGLEDLKQGDQYKFIVSKTVGGDVGVTKLEGFTAPVKPFTETKVSPIVQESKEAAKALTVEEKIIETIKDKPIETVVNVVNKIKDGKKQSKLIKTILDSDKTSPELKEQVAKTADKMYDPITNKATFDEAKDFVENDYQGALDYFKTTKQIDAKYNAVGQTLAKQADAEGRYGDAIEIINELRKQATQKGQFVQAFSVWDKMSPDGMLYFAQKEIDKANEAKGPLKRIKEKIVGKSPKQVEQKTKEVVTKLKEINKKEIENVISSSRTDKAINIILNGEKSIPKIKEETTMVQPSLFPKLDLNKIIAESENPLELSKKIQSYLTSVPAKVKTHTQEMIETLFRLSKEMLPEKKAVKSGRNQIEVFADALKNRKEYSTVWDRAEQLLKQRYKNEPETLAKLQDTFDHIIGRPFGKKDVATAVKKSLKEEGVVIKDLIRQHYTQLQKAKSTLIQDIVSKTGYKEADVKILIDEIAKEFNLRTSEAKKKALETLFKDRKVAATAKKTTIDKMIELSNLGVFDESKYLPKIQEKLGIKGTLTEDTAKFISEKMKLLQGITDETEKSKIIKEVFEKINEQIPVSISEIFDAYRYQNMLSSPRTQLRNIFFNLLQTFITRPTQMAVETPIDWIGATLTGRERERYIKDVPIYYKNVFNSFGDGIESFKEVWGGKRIDFKNPDFERFRMDKLPKGVTHTSRFMEGMDQFLRAMIVSGEKAVQLSHGATEEKAIAEATRIANYSLLKGFTDPKNKMGQGALLSKIDEITNLINKGGKVVPGMKWFVPFVNTPMRFAKQWIEYSPFGVATMVGSTRKTEQIAKTLMGSAVTLWGAKMAMDGNTTWSSPKNETDKRLFYASGRKPYSVRIPNPVGDGDVWVPMIFFGPSALALALPAAYKYRFQDSPSALTDSTLEKTTKLIGSTAEFFSQQTFMQGLGKYIDLISGNADYSLPGAMAFTAGQVVPFQGLDRYIATIVDPTYRKAKGFKESFMKDIPGLSKKLPPIESIGGEVAMREWYNFLLPFDIGKSKNEYDKLMAQRQKATQLRAVTNEENKIKEQKLNKMAREFMSLDTNTRKEKLKEVIQSGGTEDLKDLLNKLKASKKIEEMEVSFYKSLDVKSGLRATFIKQELTDLGSDREAKREFLLNMVKNKVLTKEVMAQLLPSSAVTPATE